MHGSAQLLEDRTPELGAARAGCFIGLLGRARWKGLCILPPGHIIDKNCNEYEMSHGWAVGKDRSTRDRPKEEEPRRDSEQNAVLAWTSKQRRCSARKLRTCTMRHAQPMHLTLPYTCCTKSTFKHLLIHYIIVLIFIIKSGASFIRSE
eukprot:1140878-Pelagomonas_calceolata.AAC.6